MAAAGSPAGDEPFTLGVEEEFQIVDARTRELRPRSAEILAAADLGDGLHPELTAAQVETVSGVCADLSEVRAELVRLRSGAMAAAEATGSRIAALGTHPVTGWLGQGFFTRDRYVDIIENYGLLAHEQQICGYHVHVGIADREAAIGVLDRLRPWLAPLLALSANSPFWQGIDTGYASYRTPVFDRWPTTGVPPAFGSRKRYDELMEQMVFSGAVPEPSKIYWDVRPSHWFDTLEFRVADVCMTVDEAVMVAGLARGLVATLYDEVVREVPFVDPWAPVLRSARWQAARFGLEGRLFDVRGGRPVPAHDLVRSMLDFVRPALTAFGEYDEVAGIVERTLREGNGAQRQRALAAGTADLRVLVDMAVTATADAAPMPPLGEAQWR